MKSVNKIIFLKCSNYCKIAGQRWTVDSICKSCFFFHTILNSGVDCLCDNVSVGLCIIRQYLANVHCGLAL